MVRPPPGRWSGCTDNYTTPSRRGTHASTNPIPRHHGLILFYITSRYKGLEDLGMISENWGKGKSVRHVPVTPPRCYSREQRNRGFSIMKRRRRLVGEFQIHGRRAREEAVVGAAALAGLVLWWYSRYINRDTPLSGGSSILSFLSPTIIPSTFP